eukprot:Hpha_TRINITY_DN18553_c0_g1::TRINITY_DN18553_c0_g1_i1::g.195086::m.195086
MPVVGRGRAARAGGGAARAEPSRHEKVRVQEVLSRSGRPVAELLRGLRPGFGELNVALGRLAKGNWRRACGLFRWMVSAQGPGANRKHAAALQMGLTRGSAWACSLRVYTHTMPNAGMAGNVVNVLGVIMACGSGRCWALSLRYLRGQQSTEVANASMTVCVDAREWARALGVARGMLEDGVAQSSVSGGVVMRAVAMSRRWQAALAFYAARGDA